jgi:hypothetical protein
VVAAEGWAARRLPQVMIPISRPRSTTGNRRTCRCCMIRSASASVVVGSTKIGGVLIQSATDDVCIGHLLFLNTAYSGQPAPYHRDTIAYYGRPCTRMSGVVVACSTVSATLPSAQRFNPL